VYRELLYWYGGAAAATPGAALRHQNPSPMLTLFLPLQAMSHISNSVVGIMMITLIK
jgi:hypothetical protein